MNGGATGGSWIHYSAPTTPNLKTLHDLNVFGYYSVGECMKQSTWKEINSPSASRGLPH